MLSGLEAIMDDKEATTHFYTSQEASAKKPLASWMI